MRIGTTPNHTFVLPFEVEKLAEMKVTYSQNGKVVLEKYLADGEKSGRAVSFTLSQEETFLFDNNVNVEVQARVLTAGGDALASDIRIVTAKKCLDNEVLA